MPADLHDAIRRGRRLLTVAGALRVAVLSAAPLALLPACTRGETSSFAVAEDAAAEGAEAGASDDAVPDPPPNHLLRAFAREGQVAAKAVEKDCGDRAAYLTIRKDAAASLSSWRRRLPVVAEAAYGPEVATSEAGGAIGALDHAVQAHDCPAATEAAGQLEGAFHLTRVSLTGHEVTPVMLGQAMSDATYRLGQAVSESTPFVPEADDAALADAAGFLALVDGGARVLGLDLARADAGASALEAIRTARTLADVTDRAAVIRATGSVGLAIRNALLAQGVASRLTVPYRPLRGPEVSALALPTPALPADPARAAIGKRLFFDRRLSAHGARACADCHDPKRAYDDGLRVPASLDPSVPLRRNTPTLLYAPVQAFLTWDGHVRTADRQALGVIHTAAEMGGIDAEIVRALAADPGYAAAFARAFGGDAGAAAGSVTAQGVGLALAEFEASALVPGTAPIDRFARGDDAALSRDARAGFDVFTGKGRCARCHVPPVFGGTRPPDFTAPVFAILGVPRDAAGGLGSDAGAPELDADPGRGEGSFRVPTLRNVGRTAPYFHHGRFATLEQVVDFYDRGGGAGLGLAVHHQDPEVRPLHLTGEDKRVLMVFMQDALDDTR